MTKKEIKICKEKILKCLTEDFTYGRRKDGKPLKCPNLNQAIFDNKEGYACFGNTDLKMVMDKVMLGLYFALEDTND